MKDESNRNSLLNIEFSPAFFNDEIREGFYVSEMMKRYWAGQLKVLSEIAKICDRYSIRWFADCGTLIGAVRHGGYIPWDDDLDICMLREDYERFMEVADKELPEEYSILSIEKEPKYELMLGRVVNAKSFNNDQRKIREFYGCPYTVGVDIFPLDGLAKDKNREEERVALCKELFLAVQLVKDGKQDTEVGRKILADIERHNHTVLHRKGELINEILLLVEKMYKAYPTFDAEKVAIMTAWVREKRQTFPQKIFDYYVTLPFENTFVNVSYMYEKLLSFEFGNYMCINKSGAAHDYPLYKVQENVIRDYNGGKHLFRYTLTEKELSNRFSEYKRIDFKVYCNEIIGLLKRVNFQIKELFNTENYGTLNEILEGCQSIAISLGTEIEKRVTDCRKIIDLLEKYCERVYVCHEKLSDGILLENDLKELSDLSSGIEEQLKDILENRKRKILFLPCGPMWWGSLDNIYYNRINDIHNECIVVSIPCYQKNLDEEIIGLVEDTNEYPENVVLSDRNIIDFEKYYYDEIIIQFPFDGWNKSMTIPTQFFSDNLVKYTDSLVYTPCFVPKFTEQHDAKLCEALKTLVEQPTMVYSDKVVLHSDKERETYLSILDELTHGKYTAYWQEKLVVLQKTEEISYGFDNSVKRVELIGNFGLPVDFMDGKIILYHVGISSLVQYRNQAVERLKETISDITDKADSIKCIFSAHPNVTELERIDAGLWDEYMSFIDSLRKVDVIYVDEKMDALRFIDIADGYYGDADEVAHRCRNKGIPVMIRKADLFD